MTHRNSTAEKNRPAPLASQARAERQAILWRLRRECDAYGPLTSLPCDEVTPDRNPLVRAIPAEEVEDLRRGQQRPPSLIETAFREAGLLVRRGRDRDAMLSCRRCSSIVATLSTPQLVGLSPHSIVALHKCGGAR